MLFIFVHLKVKTIENDDRFREVLAPWINSWLEREVSMLSYDL